MRVRRLPLALFGGLLVFAGLAVGLRWRPAPDRPARPAAGDRVRPDVQFVGDWRGGRRAFLNVRLLVQGPADGAPVLLRNVEVPEDFAPRLRLIFYRDGAEVLRQDALFLERTC